MFKFIKKWIFEIVKTLSNEKSFLSSKRLERLILFWSALTVSLFYFWIHRLTITTAEVVIICSMLFGYAGFNTVMTSKDIKKEKENEL